MEFNRAYNIVSKSYKRVVIKIGINVLSFLLIVCVVIFGSKFFNRGIVFIIISIIGLSTLIFLYTYRIYDIIGSLHLSKNQINIRLKESLLIKLDEVEKFTVFYKASENEYNLEERLSRSLRQKDGIGNIVEIKTRDNTFRFDCLFIGPYENLFLNSYIEHLKSLHIETKFKNV